MTKSESGGKAVKSISIMAVLILLAKFMGLFREMLIAGIYGQGYASRCYRQRDPNSAFIF